MKGVRRRGRTIAFQTLYRYDMTGEDPETLLDFSWADAEATAGAEAGAPEPRALEPEVRDFAALLVCGALENLPAIDDNIRAHLQNWDFTRLARVDLAILRISVYALLYQPDIPPSVTIDEAVEIAKDFGTDDSYRFINGVLDAIRKRAQQ